jgi:hypothetical protein
VKTGRLRAGVTRALALRRPRLGRTRPGVGIVWLELGADAVHGLALVVEPWIQEKDLEAAAGVEPAMEVLQTSALPLGYAARRRVVERVKGLEPSTFCMASRRSSRLSYTRSSRG